MSTEEKKLYRWDTKPPPEFFDWHKQNGDDGNPITAWNCDRERQEFYKAKGREELPF